MGRRATGPVGARAESAAFDYLVQQGLRPVARNYRCRGGEIDLIMLHGQCLFEFDKEKQQLLLDLKKQHPDKRVMLLAEKGTMGVGSSRMSGVNNVALWTGVQASPYVPFINIAPIVGGTNGRDFLSSSSRASLIALA